MVTNPPKATSSLFALLTTMLGQGPGTVAQWAALVGAFCTARYGAALGSAVQSAIIGAAALVVAVVTHERHSTVRAKVGLQKAETEAAGAIAHQRAMESAASLMPPAK